MINFRVVRNPDSPNHKIPMVSLEPITLEDGTVGFIVKKEIVYKPNPFYQPKNE